jgi:hypothetical protein
MWTYKSEALEYCQEEPTWSPIDAGPVEFKITTMNVVVAGVS